MPITKPGDIWALGKHRLCCGDATDPAAVARLMQGDAATLMFTSPPYAQQRDYGAAKEKVGDWDALMQGVFTAAPVTDEAQLLVNLGLVHRDSEWQPYWEGWVEWMRKSGWRRFGFCGCRLYCKRFVLLERVIDCGLLSGLQMRPFRRRWPVW